MANLSLPRRLVLLRHAKSDWESDATRDFDRPLAERGVAAGAQVARSLGERGLLPEWVLCSPAVRTRATWDFVAAHLELPAVEVFDPALYLASARALLARIRETPARVSSVMVIGHNPGLQDLAAELARRTEQGIGEAVTTKFPTAAVLAVEIDGNGWEGVGSEPHRLLAWYTPKGKEPLEF